MARKPRIYLPVASWPAEDQARWQAAFEAGDRFDGSGPGSHLAEATRRNLWISYARFLMFLSATRYDLLHLRPEARVDRLIVADYVAWRRRSCGYGMVAVDLDGLRGTLRLICPGVDWSWLLTLSKRMKAAAPPKPRKYHLVTSDHLYALGIEIMDHAVAGADSAELISKAHALEYRDGLIIALLALIPLRSRALVALRIGKQLLKTGDFWDLDIPAADTRHDERSTIRSRKSYARASICIWNGSDADSPVLISTLACGRLISGSPCPLLRFITRCADAPKELSDLR